MSHPVTIIGERINPGFRSSALMLEEEDLPGLQALATRQAAAGATYLSLNVGVRGEREPAFAVAVLEAVQAATELPIAIDSPDVAVQEACLKAYRPELAGGKAPLVNSIAETRLEFLDLAKIRPFRLLAMASERGEGGEAVPNRSAEEVRDTARRLAAAARGAGAISCLDDLIIDVSLGPLASDMEDLTRQAVDSIRLLGSDPELAGSHLCVGLSNLSIMLPKQAADGGPLGIRLENAFLTETVPHGLDHILGTPWRHYALLDDDDFVLRGLRHCLAANGFEVLERVQELYEGVPA